MVVPEMASTHRGDSFGVQWLPSEAAGGWGPHRAGPPGGGQRPPRPFPLRGVGSAVSEGFPLDSFGVPWLPCKAAGGWGPPREGPQGDGPMT